ncbi:hypothetical protein WAI453_013525 [Rhynchosporium graminicola]
MSKFNKVIDQITKEIVEPAGLSITLSQGKDFIFDHHLDLYRVRATEDIFDKLEGLPGVSVEIDDGKRFAEGVWSRPGPAPRVKQARGGDGWHW